MYIVSVILNIIKHSNEIPSPASAGVLTVA